MESLFFVQTVRQLLQLGASPIAETRQGVTLLLSIAEDAGNDDMVALLRRWLAFKEVTSYGPRL